MLQYQMAINQKPKEMIELNAQSRGLSRIYSQYVAKDSG